MRQWNGASQWEFFDELTLPSANQFLRQQYWEVLVAVLSRCFHLHLQADIPPHRLIPSPKEILPSCHQKQEKVNKMIVQRLLLEEDHFDRRQLQNLVTNVPVSAQNFLVFHCAAHTEQLLERNTDIRLHELM
jgi:hypothetical protein